VGFFFNQGLFRGFVRALVFAPLPCFNFVVSRHLSGSVHWVTIAGCVHVQGFRGLLQGRYSAFAL
jgi:hypothetical protein